MEDMRELKQEELDQIAGGDTSEGYRWVYVIKKNKCNGCGICVSECPNGAIYMSGSKAAVNTDACRPCGGVCSSVCPKHAPYSKCIRD